MLITWRSRSSFIELCDVIIAVYVVAHHNLNTSLNAIHVNISVVYQHSFVQEHNDVVHRNVTD